MYCSLNLVELTWMYRAPYIYMDYLLIVKINLGFFLHSELHTCNINIYNNKADLSLHTYLEKSCLIKLHVSITFINLKMLRYFFLMKCI